MRSARSRLVDGLLAVLMVARWYFIALLALVVLASWASNWGHWFTP